MTLCVLPIALQVRSRRPRRCTHCRSTVVLARMNALQICGMFTPSSSTRLAVRTWISPSWNDLMMRFVWSRLAVSSAVS